MTPVLLGVRLALTPAGRVRSALVVLSALLATVVLLTALAAGRFELLRTLAYQEELPRLVAAAVAAVALPCAVLLATIARLSAALRDRRLASLRLIGLSPAQTRGVTAAETGVAALAGAVLGRVVFELLGPLLIAHPLAGRSWDVAFRPTVVDQAVVLLGVPALTAVASLLPTRVTGRNPLAVARRADRTPPGWWRLVPLALGATLCCVVVGQGRRPSSDATGTQVALFFAGTALLALGLVLVLPVLVRLLTRALAGRALGPAARIAVRRLEAQPAGVARIVGALLIGLFLVTGARFVLTAFESTPQYVAASYDRHVAQRIGLDVTRSQVGETMQHLRATPGVRDVVDLPTVRLPRRTGITAAVATCDDLRRIGADVSRCRDGQAAWLMRDTASYLHDFYPTMADGPLAWRGGPTVSASTPADLPFVDLGPAWRSSPSGSNIWAVLPPSQVRDLPAATHHNLVVIGAPGRGLIDHVSSSGVMYVAGDDSAYEFVASMRAVVWSVAAIVLGVGLLALAIATVDRTIQRRKEVVALQLVGLGPRVLRRAQLIETGLPVTLGSALAVGLGALAGATFLTLGDSLGMPWRQTWVLLGVAVLGCLAVTGMAMLTSAPRLRPEEIRAE